MASTLVPASSTSTLFTALGIGRLQGPARVKGSVMTTAFLRPSGARKMNFASLRCNAINFLGRPKRDFYPGMRTAVGLRRPKAHQGVLCTAMFKRLTENSLAVIKRAEEEARLFGFNFVGTEHILLGLISEGTGIAAEVLRLTGIDLKDARDKVERIDGRGSGRIAFEISFTTKAKLVLDCSLKAARELEHSHIGPEHLLVGLIRSGGGIAGAVLKNLGADLDEIHEQVLKMMMSPKDKEFETDQLDERGIFRLFS